MRILPAAIMSVGILVFTIGIGMFIVFFSEAKTIAYVGTESATERRVSLNERALQGFYLMSIGAALATFIIMETGTPRTGDTRTCRLEFSRSGATSPGGT